MKITTAFGTSSFLGINIVLNTLLLNTPCLCLFRNVCPKYLISLLRYCPMTEKVVLNGAIFLKKKTE